MPNPNPIGEEIWLRREYQPLSKAYTYRDLSYFGFLNFITWGLIPTTIAMGIVMPSVTRFLIGFGPPTESWAVTVGFSILICLPVSTLTAIPLLKTIRCYSKCPLWLYAEQLNPEQLKIYHLRKPPTIIKLAGSTLDPKTKFKYYTTLTVTDQATETSATLGLLTPEEYDRFMQYWNAANPSAVTEDQE